MLSNEELEFRTQIHQIIEHLPNCKNQKKIQTCINLITITVGLFLCSQLLVRTTFMTTLYVALTNQPLVLPSIHYCPLFQNIEETLEQLEDEINHEEIIKRYQRTGYVLSRTPVLYSYSILKTFNTLNPSDQEKIKSILEFQLLFSDKEVHPCQYLFLHNNTIFNDGNIFWSEPRVQTKTIFEIHEDVLKIDNDSSKELFSYLFDRLLYYMLGWTNIRFLISFCNLLFMTWIVIMICLLFNFLLSWICMSEPFWQMEYEYIHNTYMSNLKELLSIGFQKSKRALYYQQLRQQQLFFYRAKTYLRQKRLNLIVCFIFPPMCGIHLIRYFLGEIRICWGLIHIKPIMEDLGTTCHDINISNKQKRIQ